MKSFAIWAFAASSFVVSNMAHAQMGGPPPEAFSACDGKSAGDACSHPTPHGHEVQGSCTARQNKLQCIPSFGRGGPGQGGPMGQPGMGQQGMGQQGMGQQGMGQPGMGNQDMNQRGGMDQRRMGPNNMRSGQGGREGLDSNGNSIGHLPGGNVTFRSLQVPFERMAPVEFTQPDGRTHWYEVVYLPKGGVNWSHAKMLSEEAGGYLVSLTSREENAFVFGLVQDTKYWFKWDQTHNYVMNGPFIGAYQPVGSPEPSGGWKWVSGEPWSYTNWARDGQPGDRDPRPNGQPNDSQGSSNIAALGEVNDPVSTWGDFPHRFSSPNSSHDGKAYGFIIEYDRKP